MKELILDVIDPILGELEPDSQVYSLLVERQHPARLSFLHKSYYYVRPYIPLKLRRKLQSLRRVDVKDGWFITEKLTNTYKQILGDNEYRARRRMLWPKTYRSAVVLTHDVETQEGLHFVPKVIDLEQKYGFTSSWNIVPYLYTVDTGILKCIEESGCEIGVHGYNHDGRLYFSERIFQKRTPLINRALRKYDAIGFRSPALHRNLEWLQQLNIDYDASCFDIDPFQPMPGGTHSIWPFKVGHFIELPYTLPQDHVLWIQLMQRSNEIWIKKSNWLYENFGMMLLITHPDYLMLAKSMELYEGFLEHLCAFKALWRVLPRDLTNYWFEKFTSMKEHRSAKST